VRGDLHRQGDGLADGGAPAPEQAPRGAVPADNGVGVHEQDGVPQAPEAAGQCTEEPPIEAAPPRSFDVSADDDQLLAKDQVLGHQGCPGRYDGQEADDYVARFAEERDGDGRALVVRNGSPPSTWNRRMTFDCAVAITRSARAPLTTSVQLKK
jgi:hypothetical protein